MTKHSLAPWTARADARGFDILGATEPAGVPDPAHDIGIYGPRGRVVARILGADEEGRQNAALVVAAPNLLAALRDVAEYERTLTLTEGVYHDKGYDSPDLLRNRAHAKMLAAARAAIAKADAAGALRLPTGLPAVDAALAGGMPPEDFHKVSDFPRPVRPDPAFDLPADEEQDRAVLECMTEPPVMGPHSVASSAYVASMVERGLIRSEEQGPRRRWFVTAAGMALLRDDGSDAERPDRSGP